MKFSYKALQLKQTNSGKMIVLFAASATEIEKWAGIPQKKKFGTNEETLGFQREENLKRIDSLSEFFKNGENIIQNPLLCSTRKLSVAGAAFTPKEGEDGDIREGIIEIEIPDYEEIPLLEIFRLVRIYIENRVKDLESTTLDDKLIAKLKAKAADEGHLPAINDIDDISECEYSTDASSSEAAIIEAESVLFDESHIIDFWQEIACRHEVLKLIEQPQSSDEFLGFTRNSLLSYLRPIVLVDGQHRLKGALKAAKDKLNEQTIQEEIEAKIASGETAKNVEDNIIKREARRLPISLLLADDPAEQVFQFVVVNQKATPIGRALLGTIVSTTLCKEEMETVASRLKDAGIPLEESQAITYLARFPASPFFGLVERGMTGDAKDLLQWGVFVSLIGIFRDLRGGKLFHAKNDYAQVWKTKYLSNSGIISQYLDNSSGEPFEYWRKLDGPWRDVFIAFFSKIRDEFGTTEVSDAHNFWGKPRESNLFNKISLTILAADFFQYLVERKQGIDSKDHVPVLVDDWLEGVSRSYFNIDWNLSGVKKDSTGIRNQWSYQWNEYRKNPIQLPQKRVYRNPKAD